MYQFREEQIKNRLQTWSSVGNFTKFVIYDALISSEPDVNKCADWSRTYGGPQGSRQKFKTYAEQHLYYMATSA